MPTTRSNVSSIVFSILCTAAIGKLGLCQPADVKVPNIDNPMSVEYLQENLRQSLPRLVFTPEIEERLRNKLETDPVLKNMFRAIRLNADRVMEEELLTRRKIGRRLLSTCREMLWRMNVLGFAYRMERDPRVLNRINDELLAVCSFQDWNPDHFLDVAEMSLAVALALDWTAGELPESTIRTAQTALIEKGIRPGANKGHFRSENNWNQVCNGGMIAAAIAIADVDPELAANTISRALDGLPNALKPYGPDGVHPEAASYWEYATGYTAITASMLESAFGTDFGIWEFPGLAKSGMYRVLMSTPSGRWFNYGDCADRRSENGDLTLAWFAAKSGDKTFYESERFLRSAEEMGTLSRWAGIAMVWLSQFEPQGESQLPPAWAGGGVNPVVVFRGGQDDPHSFYFAAKGGCGSVNHGNMDGGSFILELDGVRWAEEIGNQSYHQLEQSGLNLWDSSQDGDRWKLLSKNNFGHSTLTINGQLHRVAGNARVLYFRNGPKPEAAFDLQPAFGDLAPRQAKRVFVQESPTSVLIKDSLELSDEAKQVTWQMLSVADVEAVSGGAWLRQDGQRLKLDIQSHPELTVSVVSLDPPPMKLDREITGLKRIEIDLSPAIKADRKLELCVRLGSDS